ncbi:MAG: hypothetical protein AAF591_22040 [Verrucomicrobiota bacterium]
MASHFDNLKDRAHRADQIIREPKAFKICFGCDSIVAAEVTLCPNCHAYRFETEEKLIVAQAKLLGSREKQTVLASDFD